MKAFIAVTLAATLAFSPAAFAGGPVVIEDVEVVAEESTSSFGILPIIIVGVALCAAICGGDDDQVLVDQDQDVPVFDETLDVPPLDVF